MENCQLMLEHTLTYIEAISVAIINVLKHISLNIFSTTLPTRIVKIDFFFFRRLQQKKISQLIDLVHAATHI